MADLVATYTTSPASSVRVNRGQYVELETGNEADTEALVIGVASVAGAKAATASRRVLSLLAEAACWITVATAPVAAAGSGRKLLANERTKLWLDAGESVAVIQA